MNNLINLCIQEWHSIVIKWKKKEEKCLINQVTKALSLEAFTDALVNTTAKYQNADTVK